MPKWAVSKKCMFGKHVFDGISIYWEGDNIVIETPDKLDLSKGVKLDQ